LLIISFVLVATAHVISALAANAVDGRVLAGGEPIAKSTVTLWLATADAPKQVAQAQSGDDGRFTLNAENIPEGILYVIAKGGAPAAHKGEGDNPAIAFLSVLGRKPPSEVTIDEFTTVASVWTNAQFLDGDNLRGPQLGLKIAVGNLPSFVDLQTGGWGIAIQDPLNSSQTPTMANFATIADGLSGCVLLVTSDACEKLFAAAIGPRASTPKDTLAAAEAIARYPWYQPQRLYSLLAQFYPISPVNHMRTVPFMPYLSTAPSAWVLPLKFTGGGYLAGGKAMFDSKGDLWVGDNFTIGWQAQDSFWQGHATEFDPNGHPLSPMTIGFSGGGMEGGTFGAAIDAKDNVWLSSYGGKSIAVFDQSGKPTTPPEGINFGHRLGLMQGIIATPSGDVWALGLSKNQLLYFPKGDPTQGKIVCEGFKAEPCKSLIGPFHLGIDQQSRIWVTNAFGDHVTRFPSSDPTKAENFKTGWSGSGLGIDSQGNVWVTNRLGNSVRGAAVVADMIVTLKLGGNGDEKLTRAMAKQRGGRDSGSVSLLRPDGSQFPGSPFSGNHLPGPWAATVDGNDNVWISNFAAPNSPITELCGARTQNCPPGFKTGQAISPPGGYVGGGLQMQTDLAVSPAGDVWVMDNWQDIDSCFSLKNEAISTRCGGQGVTIFFGMAKPVRSPQIGPAQPLD
jgi:streptogramin lyase